MTKEKIRRLFENYFFQLGIAFLAALALILISIVFIEDVELDNMMLIYNIFGTLTLIGFINSYNLTHKKLRSQLQVGKTRKEVYFSHLLNTIIILFVASFLVIYYMLIYGSIIKRDFHLRDLVFLPLIFLLASEVGLMFGIIKIGRKLFNFLFSVIVIGLVLMVIYLSVAFYVNFILLGVLIIIGFANYLLIKNWYLEVRK